MKGHAAFGVKNGEMLESESVHLRAALDQLLSIRETSDKTKNPAVILTRASKAGIIHFASTAEKLYQLQSVPNKACNQCLTFLNFATPLQPRRKHSAHFRASKAKWWKLPI